jgi:hypothetical protein
MPLVLPTRITVSSAISTVSAVFSILRVVALLTMVSASTITGVAGRASSVLSSLDFTRSAKPFFLVMTTGYSNVYFAVRRWMT